MIAPRFTFTTCTRCALDALFRDPDVIAWADAEARRREREAEEAAAVKPIPEELLEGRHEIGGDALDKMLEGA